ncbi:MAG: DUF6568 family protein [Bacilli bacterium]
MENKKLKNYIILILIGLFTVLLTLYLCNIIKNYKTTKISISPLTSNVSEISFNEMDEVLSEAKENILYLSKTSDIRIYTMEEKMLKLINKNKLNDKILYINVDSYPNYSKVLKERYSLLQNINIVVPAILYYKDGNILYYKTSTSKKIINENELLKVVDLYEEKN